MIKLRKFVIIFSLPVIFTIKCADRDLKDEYFSRLACEIAMNIYTLGEQGGDMSLQEFNSLVDQALNSDLMFRALDDIKKSQTKAYILREISLSLREDEE